MAVDRISVTGEMERLRTSLLRSLVELTPRENRAYAEDLATQIETANRMLEASRETPRRLNFTRAIDAIQYVLDREGPLTDEELVQAVTATGFAAHEQEVMRRANILRSIGQYTTGVAGRRKQVIRKVGNLIGRGEWPDERFS